MVTAPLPTPLRPGTWAAVARQIDSIRSLGIEVDVLEIEGLRGIKYLQALRRLSERSVEYSDRFGTRVLARVVRTFRCDAAGLVDRATVGLAGTVEGVAAAP